MTNSILKAVYPAYYKERKPVTSPKYTLTKQDFNKWGHNALVFAAPALIVFLTAIQSGVPVEDALYAVYLWGLNTMIDLLKKFVRENP